MLANMDLGLLLFSAVSVLFLLGGIWALITPAEVALHRGGEDDNTLRDLYDYELMRTGDPNRAMSAVRRYCRFFGLGLTALAAVFLLVSIWLHLNRQ